MVFKLPRFTKSTQIPPSPEPEAEAAVIPPPSTGVTVSELEEALGSMYTAPSLVDY